MKAQVLTVKNKKGKVFRIGDKILFFGKKYIIKAFRTDSSMPNWISTENIEDRNFWIMAQVQGKGHWINIDFAKKLKHE